MPTIHEDTPYPFSKPYGFIRIVMTPLSYGFINIHTQFQFFNCRTGKFIQLADLHKELEALTENERLVFWNYIIQRDLYLELMKDSRLKSLPQSVRQHVSYNYKI